ncbi:MAG: ADP-ribosylglycohydrolase family protein [Clostridiales bacterium]|nr:ADP-ribosylglycohydrolase family protein [Clostridiales bacterium]
MKKRGKLDAIRGSLIGGAVGDALGYAIEFWQEDQIFHTYGSNGITEYALVDGKAQISDDTQMTLFTAAGILVGDTRMSMNGNGDKPRTYVAMAYQDWLKTQRSDIHGVNPYKRHTREGEISWLLDVPELYALRAPGNTCLSSLAQRGCGEYVDDFMKNPVNHKGDSDSTGAVTGNILGTLVGYETIEEKWKNHLELSDVILEMADDLYQGCQTSESGGYSDLAWESKYVRGRRYPRMS